MGCLNSKSTEKLVVSKKTNSINIKFDKDLSSEEEAGKAANAASFAQNNSRSSVVGQDIVLQSASNIIQDNTMAVDQTEKQHQESTTGIDTGSFRKKVERKQNGTFQIDDKPIKETDRYSLPRDSDIASEGPSQAYSSQKSTFHASAQAKKLQEKVVVVPPPSMAVNAVRQTVKLNSPRADLK